MQLLSASCGMLPLPGSEADQQHMEWLKLALLWLVGACS